MRLVSEPAPVYRDKLSDKSEQAPARRGQAPDTRDRLPTSRNKFSAGRNRFPKTRNRFPKTRNRFCVRFGFFYRGLSKRSKKWGRAGLSGACKMKGVRQIMQCSFPLLGAIALFSFRKKSSTNGAKRPPDRRQQQRAPSARRRLRPRLWCVGPARGTRAKPGRSALRARC